MNFIVLFYHIFFCLINKAHVTLLMIYGLLINLMNEWKIFVNLIKWKVVAFNWLKTVLM